VSGEDADAPLAHWTAHIRLSDLPAILHDGGAWAGGPIARVSLDGDTVVVAGARTARMSRSWFRIALNNEGPCRFPRRYPDAKGSARGGPLPQTIPSTTFGLSQKGGILVVSGRGWGHDVGMSQYGARSLAERHRSARQILAHFYGPAQVTTIREPGAIRVLAAEGLRRVRIDVLGRVSVTTSTGSVLAPGKRFEIRGGRLLTTVDHVTPDDAVLEHHGYLSGELILEDGRRLTFEIHDGAVCAQWSVTDREQEHFVGLSALDNPGGV
jgi:hypothetical protein